MANQSIADLEDQLLKKTQAAQQQVEVSSQTILVRIFNSSHQELGKSSLAHMQQSQTESRRLMDVEERQRREITRLVDAKIALEQENTLLSEVRDEPHVIGLPRAKEIMCHR